MKTSGWRKSLIVASILGVLFLGLVWALQFTSIGCQDYVGCISRAVFLILFGLVALPVVALVTSLVLVKEKKWSNAFTSAFFTGLFIAVILSGQAMLNKKEISRNVRDAEVFEVELLQEQQARRPSLPSVGVEATLRGTIIRVYEDREYGSYLDLRIDADGKFNSRLKYLEGKSGTEKCANPLIGMAQITPGSYVEFKAMTTGVGAFSTCDSSDYYIKVLSASSSPE